MRRTRTIALARTLAVSGLASLATVVALAGGAAATAQDAPANTAEPRITGAAHPLEGEARRLAGPGPRARGERRPDRA